MYVTRLVVSNIRSIERFEFSLPEDRLPGWHVLLGDNGAGKSTIVRALALALSGPDEARALRQPWSNWLSFGADEGVIAVEVSSDEAVDTLSIPNFGQSPKVCGELIFKPSPGDRVPLVELKPAENPHTFKAFFSLWGSGKGWFSASYGPFRRFTGGNRDWEQVFRSNPKLAPHLSAFGEDVALSEALDWLKTLHVRALEKGDEDIAILEPLKAFINEGGLLPHGARLDRITSESVTFRDGNGQAVPVDQLSDGYRSILSLTFELIRQMVASYGHELVFRRIRTGVMEIDLPGVVAIDEIDAHLHPAWQKRIGLWFLKYFPKLQFIVTTHSPIICQAAENGTIWRLPTPGSGEEGRRVEGTDFHRLVRGNVLEAYDTDLFGERVARSDASRQSLMRLAVLNRKALQGALTDEERRERDELRASMPTTASVATRTGLPLE